MILRTLIRLHDPHPPHNVRVNGSGPLRNLDARVVVVGDRVTWTAGGVGWEVEVTPALIAPRRLVAA